MSHGIDTPVQAMEATDLGPVRDRRPNDAQRFQLPRGDHAMLPERHFRQSPLLMRSYFVQHGTYKYERTGFSPP
jgi:hypothetical protein